MGGGDSMESLPETSSSGRNAEATVEEYHALLKQLQGWIKEGLLFDLATRKRELHLSLVRLRSVNRELALQVRSRKRRVQQVKSVIDRDELIRQTLLYQKNHLQATIEDTRQHPSLYASIIEVGETAGGMGTDSDVSMSIEAPNEQEQHQTRLHKLRRELEMRRALSDGLKARVESLELAKSRLVLKRKELERLRDQLEGIIKASDPLAHSQARLFAELTAARQQMSADDQSGKEDDDQMGMGRAMERLGQQLTSFVEGRHDMNVFSFEEVELGEEPIEEEATSEQRSEDEPPIDLTAARDENADGEADGDEETRSGEHHHGRFASHHVRASGSGGRRRRYDHAHILMEITRQQQSEGGDTTDMGSTDEPIRIIFVPIDGEQAIGLQLDMSDGDSKSAEQIETFLLSLPLEPALLLTVPLHGEQQPRHPTGCIPFRWIQCLAGLSSPDSAFADAQAVLHAFLMAIKGRAGTIMRGGGDL